MRVVSIAAALVLAPHVHAIQAMQSFTVNSTQDLIDDNTSDSLCHTAANTCTLRAAVMQANRSPGEGATIHLPAGTYTLTISPSGARGDDNGDLDLVTPASGNPVISIVGAGAASTIIDANFKDRAFYVHTGRTAAISGVTIRNGYAGFAVDISDGGGIRNDGTLTVSGSTISGNTAVYFGGGIRNDGTLSVILSAIIGNVAGNGGGISNFNGGSLSVIKTTLGGNLATRGGGITNGGTLYLSQSTLSGNGGHDAASLGGGIWNFGALFVTDSTLSLNSVNADGGGIYNQGTANIYNSTIAYNDADSDANSVGYGGGVYIANATTLNIRNTLLVGNYVRGYPDFHSDCWGDGTLVPYGLNFTTTLGVCNVSNGAWSVLNSLAYLGPLQNNGGPTQTVALLSGSNAIDVGDPTFGFDCLDQNSDPILTDQRGFTRPAGYFCDIGAFEYGAMNPVDEIFKNGFE